MNTFKNLKEGNTVKLLKTYVSPLSFEDIVGTVCQVNEMAVLIKTPQDGYICFDKTFNLIKTHNAIIEFKG